MLSQRLPLPAVVPTIVLLALLVTVVGSSRAEGELGARERLPRIPAVETAADDLAVLRQARLKGKGVAPTRVDPHATATEDRALPPTTGVAPRNGPKSPQELAAESAFLDRFAAKSPVQTTVGGDDLLVLSSPSIRDYEMEITADGDIYLAVTHVPEGTPVRVDVFLSEDGGSSWEIWGSRASASYHYDWASLHVAEGPNARVFLAYVFYEAGSPLEDDAGVIVASSPLDAEASWSLTLAFWVPGSDFRSPNITSDHESWNNYRVYLTAHENDAEGVADIWFGASNDFGASFGSYEIGTLSGVDAQYWSPDIAVGWGGYVHVTWYLYVTGGGASLNHAIRYRRATNRALGGAGSWGPTMAITSTSSQYNHQLPSVAAQMTDQNVVINYVRFTGGGSEAVVRQSVNSGSDWESANEWSWDAPYFPEVGADPGRFFYTGRRYGASSYGFTTAAAASPGQPIATEIMADDTYASIISTPGSRAHPDPTRGNRFALAWVDQHATAGEDDRLYFDAEWRADPGYPNHHENFPLPLAAEPATPPAIVDVDGDRRSNEIVFADDAGEVHVIDRFGAELPGFPAATNQTIADESLAVGDLNGDGRQEIVVGSDNGRVFAFASDGSIVPGWPVSLGTSAPAYVSIGTVSRLAPRDVVVACGRQIHLLRFDGSEHEYAKFPIVAPEELHAAAAIGDLQADGRMEIAVVSGAHVRVYDYLGQLALSMQIPGADLRNTPSLGDLDFDGSLEIVVPTDLGEVWIFEHDGSIRPGWPYDIGSVDIIQEVALADFAVSFELVLDLAFAQRGSL